MVRPTPCLLALSVLAVLLPADAAPVSAETTSLQADTPLFTTDPGNPAISAEAHLAATIAAMQYREAHRISEEDFLRMSREPGTVVLDARSREKFDLLHIEGAINLPFPDLDPASLGRVLPAKDTVVLIYCNNNFEGDPYAFMRKSISVSLNLSTYTTLYEYGYRNVYELGPLLELSETVLPLVGDRSAFHGAGGVPQPH